MWIAAGPIGLRIGIDGPEPRSLMEEAGVCVAEEL
jgi:hypothetical protein